MCEKSFRGEGAFAFLNVDFRLIYFRHAGGRWSAFKHLKQLLDSLFVALSFAFDLRLCQRTDDRYEAFPPSSLMRFSLPDRLHCCEPILSIHRKKLLIR